MFILLLKSIAQLFGNCTHRAGNNLCQLLTNEIQVIKYIYFRSSWNYIYVAHALVIKYAIISIIVKNIDGRTVYNFIKTHTNLITCVAVISVL